MKYSLDKGAYKPERAHDLDAGYDLRSTKDVTVFWLGNTVLVDTGVHVAIPKGYAGVVESKSGLFREHGITAFSGLIDAGYTGSITVGIDKHTKGEMNSDSYHFNVGDKIAQLVIYKLYDGELEQVDQLDPTERGNRGFGSTGR